MSVKLQLILSCLIIVFCSPIFGQNYSREFGDIGIKEYALKEYEADKDAEAVVLYDIGSSRFELAYNTYDVIFERRTRVKILSEGGVDYAEIQIPFSNNGTAEKVYDIEAYTYNLENGKVVKTGLDIARTFDEKINKYWNVKKFAIPNAKVGSIIEYTYKIRSKNIFNLKDWRFQWRIPVIYSEYEVRMIPFYTYAFIFQGASEFDFYSAETDSRTYTLGATNYSELVHKYAMKDVPAFKSEEFITSINDYIIKLDFQLSEINYPSSDAKEIMTTWDQMKEELLIDKDFSGYMSRSKREANKLFKVKEIKALPEQERFDFVLDFVKNNFSWNKFNGKFATKSVRKFVNDKYGNSADINLFTIGLLNAVNINAKPVLISTRANGRVKYDYPLLSYFNYVTILAEVDGIFINTDATEVLSLNNRVPSRCINDKGLIVDKEKVAWLGLEFPHLTETKNDIQIKILSNNLVQTSVSKTATEYDALNYRNNYGANLDKIKSNIDDKVFTVIDSTISIQNQEEKEKPYILSYKKTSEPEIINNKIYISPFLDDVISNNPLKQDQRTYPIDMVYPVKRTYTTTIPIPKGYTVDYMPENQEIKNQLFELSYQIIKKEEALEISYYYSFNNSIYSPTNYLHIKNFFDKIVEKGNEKIVLVKTI